ncbi:MAG: hypothetical protein IGQ45_03105 [Cyanobacterium sp. T60_A2020_053]|nr:hypothetical protein [Cyanobacterium sp. T60_A2020_053]
MNKYTNLFLTLILICQVIIMVELAPVNAHNPLTDVNIKQVGGQTVFRNLPVEVK